MGLDITAYRRLTPVQNASLDADGNPEGFNYWTPGTSMRWSETEWPGRGAGLEHETVYAWEECFDFRAGSYGGYGEWRSDLARLAGFANAQDFWARATPDAPFYELINFADNEGVIGPVVAAELARDFAAHDPGGGWFGEQYAKWRRAFEMAADGGAVDFH